MKKSSLLSLVTFIDSMDAQGSVTPEIKDIRDEIEAELAKGKAKADANRALYDTAKDIVLSALSDTPVTVAELYEEIEEELPEGFTKAKVQYALTHYWEAEVTRTLSNPNTYSRKVA